MLQLNLSEDIMQKLREVSRERQQSVEQLVETLVESYVDALPEREKAAPPWQNPLLALVGIVETEATDISDTIRETLQAHTSEHYGWTMKDARSD